MHEINSLENTGHSLSLRARDGLELFALEVPAKGERLGSAMVLPGFGDHHGRYLELAGTLASAGLAAFVPDHRGNGRSGGRRGYVRRFEDYLSDLDLLFEYIAKQGDPPLLLVGHSMGGLIAVNWLASRGASMPLLALSSPFFALALPVGMAKLAAVRLFSRLAPGLPFASGIEPRLLSHDPQVALDDAADPLLSHVTTPRWFTEAARAQARALASPAGLAVDSLLLLYGTADPIAATSAMEDFYQRLTIADRSRLTYQNKLHELFRETNRKEVLADFSAWLTPRLKKISPGK